MEIITLKAQIKSGKLDNFYIFTGEEWYVQRVYLKQIAKALNGTANSVDDVTALYARLNKRSMFEKPSLYVIRDSAEINKNPDIIDKLRSVARDNVIVLVLSSVDKRTKLYKQYKDTFIEFNTLERAVLKRHIKAEIKLSDKNIDRLIDVCEGNYGRILLEIDKIKQYQEFLNNDGYKSDKNNEFPAIYADSVLQKFLEDGTIYKPPYDAIFNFVDDVLMRDIRQAYESLDNCKRIGESTLALLSVLYTNAKQVLQVQSYEGSDLEHATGLTYVQVKYARKRCNKYRTGDLVYMLKLIHEIEMGIKTGQIEEPIAIDYLLVQIL